MARASIACGQAVCGSVAPGDLSCSSDNPDWPFRDTPALLQLLEAGSCLTYKSVIRLLA